MPTLTRLYTLFKPENYQLSLDIERPGRSFSGTVTIHGELDSSAERLGVHAKDLGIETVLIDGKQASWEQAENDVLWISHPDLKPGGHIVVIGFNGTITDAMHGMYPCYYVHDGVKKELIATQFESHHAREVFPCIDEPEAKATFDVTLTTETDVTVLGNLHPTSQRTENDRLVTTFATTPRMSTYLLAWVYGELQKKTAYTSGDVEVNVYATPAQSPDSLDFALDHAVKTIEFFDDYFGTPYPLPKSDHVALPDFSSGAMENWGLITYREVALLADPATTTVASKQYIATVVSHELSHQWFGNLVTMKWWNNLWLNESFATLMEYIAVDAIHPEWNSWLDFATHESILALRRDAIAGVQPVQVDVNHPDEISSLFDGAIVYAKGARLMRMVQNYIGHDAFRRGLANYFAEFAYYNTEADDLWRHLSEASGEDISSLMNTWISQSGYPVVSISQDGLSQEQFFIGEHEESNRLWPIPLNAESVEDMPKLLETKELRMPIAEDERLNVGDTAHFITHYPADHLERILRRDDLNDLDKLQLLHEQTLLIRAGREKSANLIRLLPHFSSSSSANVWDIIAVAVAELKKFVEEDEQAEKALRRFAGDLARNQYERLGWSPAVGESENDTKLRSTVLGMMAYSQDSDVLEHIDRLFSRGIESIDPELRSLVISSVVYRNKDDRLITRLLDIYRDTPSADLREDISSGLTSARRDEDITQLVSRLTDTDLIRPQDNARWFVYLIRNRHAREATWWWVRDNWSWIEKTFGGDKSYDYYPQYSASGLMTPKQRDEYKEFFTPLRSQPALTRVIDMGLNEIDARLDLLNRDGDDVRQALKGL